ncbi:hypothetical protein [Rugosimonospora acidiphila]|uniref:hypothetical protein n=1 Tax=Rugosimonospora acidiphila TaxID=556531 RepID=UPI0031E7D351
MRRPVLVVLLLLVGVGALFTAMSSDTGRSGRSKSADLTAAVRVPVDRERREVSRSAQRTAPSGAPESPTPSASPTPSPSPSPSVSPTPIRKPTRAATVVVRPAPVGGLSQVQMDYAATIVRVGEQLKLPKEAYVVAVATALQESQLLNLANYGVAESLDLPHDGVGGDHDSVGLFQQRPSSGWGTVEELMDPATSATKFYDALIEIPGWESMSVTEAAQAVQNSAFPDAYAQQESLATLVVAALV